MTILELITIANQLSNNNLHQAAIELYQQWLQENSESQQAYVAYFNLGVLYVQTENLQSANLAYQLALKAGSIEAGINLGLLAEQQGNLTEAVNIWLVLLNNFIENAIFNQDLYLLLLNNLGRVLERQGDITEAEAFFAQSLALEPNQPAVQNQQIYLRQQACQWPVASSFDQLDRLRATDINQMRGLLALIDDPERQSACLDQWIRMTSTASTEIFYHGQTYAHTQIHIGYLLTDSEKVYRGSLLALLKQHDRNRYEISVFTRNNPVSDIITADIPITDLNGLTDREAALVICNHEIDILIDLDGYHLGILDYHPAPIQLIYPSLTSFADHAAIDYLISDPYILPPAFNPTPEKSLYLPHCFRAENTPSITRKNIERTDSGLPNNSIVFCYSGESYKITETVFAAWMQILSQVPHSVLWLATDTTSTHDRLKQAAKSYGIHENRLLSSQMLLPDQIALADIILDTYPCSNHDHNYEALHKTIPVVTLAGKSMASRTTGSFLTTLGLPELIANSLDEYIAQAVAIGNDADRLGVIKTYLDMRRQHSPLFDVSCWVRDMETSYENLLKRQSETHQTVANYTPKTQTPKPFFTIVVVHYEGSVSRQETVRCLQSLYFQKYRNFEILLLHDGPRTLPWETEDFPPPADIRLKIHHTEQRANDYGHSLRDLGIKLARGEYILITNADNYHYTQMLLEIYMEIVKPYQQVLIDGVDRTAADIIIFGILASGYLSLGTHENIIDLREFNMQMARQQWMYLSGYPSIIKNIDCMQFVMRRELWLKEGGWRIKMFQASDGLLYQEFVKKYGVRYVVGPLAEHL